MKTLDETIELLGSIYYNDCKKAKADAVAYLKEYRSDKMQWEADRKAYQAFVEVYTEARDKHQAAVIELAKNPPLTWDELMKMEMIGTPVWSREKRRWYLIQDTALDNRSWVDLIDAYGGRFRIVEHGLKEYDLYRKERG